MRATVLWAVALLVPALTSAQESAVSGKAVYDRHCASCHNGQMPRMPSREALRSLTPEYVETALSSFTMRRQGAALTAAERRAVAEYVTGRPSGSYQPPLAMIRKSAYCRDANSRDALTGPAWNGWSADLHNTRFQPVPAAGLSADDVPRLRLKWAFGLPGVSASGSQVSIVGSRVFVGSRNGMVYALDARTGCLVWAFEADAGVRSTPVVERSANGAANVFFGDAHAQMYALDALSGALKWKVRLDSHPDAIITGGAALHDGRLFVGVSSFEELTAAIASYECCTFRGSLVAIDAATGREVWRTYPIAEEPRRTARSDAGIQMWGPSGASIWSAPTLDPARNRLYIATGDNYSSPPSAASDAILALALDTGRVLWTYQALAGDTWNVSCVEKEGPGRSNCPDTAGPDHDFGSSPALITLSDGRRMVLAGQKSGELYGLDAEAGAQLWKIKTGPGGILGGIEWGFATDGTAAYVSLSSALEKKAGEAGGLMAVNVADGRTRWFAAPAQNTCADRPGCTTAQPAAVSAIAGVVFSGSLDGHIRGYETGAGKVIWDFDTHGDIATVNGVPARGGAINGPGPTVAGGMLFLTSGYGAFSFMPGNALLAFSVDGK